MPRVFRGSAIQTFLPYADFRRSAAVLDGPRLGKQRVEAFQIARALTVEGYGWQHHPAVKMWRGYLPALITYGVVVSEVWQERGRADTCAAKIAALSPGDTVHDQAELARLGLLPPWLGRRSLHRSHRSALVRKDPEHYRRYFPRVPDDLPYVWPV